MREKFYFKRKNPIFRCVGAKWSHFKYSRGLELSARGVRMGKSGPLDRVSDLGFRTAEMLQKKIELNFLKSDIYFCFLLFKYLCLVVFHEFNVWNLGLLLISAYSLRCVFIYFSRLMYFELCVFVRKFAEPHLNQRMLLKCWNIVNK